MQSLELNEPIYDNDGLILNVKEMFPTNKLNLKTLKKLTYVDYWMNRYSRADQITHGRLGHHFRDLYETDIDLVFYDLDEYRNSDGKRKVLSNLMKSQALYELSDMFDTSVRTKRDIIEIYMYLDGLGNGDMVNLFK